MAELIILEITSECFNKDRNWITVNEQTYELSAVDNNELVFGVVDVVQNVLNYIKCFVDGISKAVEDTSLAPLWEATKKDIDAILSRLNACRNGENKVDEIR